MAGISDIMSRELIPWITSTATVGVLAGLANAAARWAIGVYQRQPMIEHDFFWSDEGHLTIAIYNRAPAPLTIVSLDAVTPASMTFTMNGRNDYVRSFEWMKELAPVASGAVTFPIEASLFFIRIGSEGDQVGRLRLKMRSKNQFILSYPRRLDIVIPRKISPK